MQNASTSSMNQTMAMLLISLSMLPMLQGVLLTPLLAIMKQEMVLQSNSTLILRIMIAAPALTIVLIIPMTGRLVDQFDRRQILVFGLLLYALCGLTAFALPGIEYLVASRLILGCSLACIMTISVASIGDLFEPAERSRILGLQYAASTLVGMFGPPLAGLIALVDWRFTFLLYLLPLFLVPYAWRLPSLPPDERAGSHRARKLEIRPIIGILILIATGTAVLWLLTLQLALHLAHGGFSSPVFAGMALGAPCLSGIMSGLLYPAVKRRLSIVAIAVSAFALMGLGYALIAQAERRIGSHGWTAAGRFRIWPQSAKLRRMAAERRERGIAGAGFCEPHPRNLHRTACITVDLRSDGFRIRLGGDISDHCGSLYRNCRVHLSRFTRSPGQRTLDVAALDFPRKSGGLF